MSPRRSLQPYQVQPGAHAPRVYFAQAPDGLVKIGHSENVGTRLITLMIEGRNLLHFLGSVPGTYHTEMVWHDHFLAFRDHGEWFRPELALLAAIAEAVALGYTPEHVRIPESRPFPPMRLGRPRRAS